MSNLDNRPWESCDVQFGQQSVGKFECPSRTTGRGKVVMSKLDIRTFPRSVVQIGHHNFPTACWPNWTLELSHALLSNLDIRIFPQSISLVFQHIILPPSTNRTIHRQTGPNIATVYKPLLFPTPTLDLTWSIYRWVSFDMY